MSIIDTELLCSATESALLTGMDMRLCMRTHSLSRPSSSEATEEQPSEAVTAEDSLDMSQHF